MRLSALAVGLVACAANRGLAQTAKEGVPSATTPSVGADGLSFPGVGTFPTGVGSLLPTVPTPARGEEQVGRFSFTFEGLSNPGPFPRVLVPNTKGQRLNFGLSQKIAVTVDRVELWNPFRQPSMFATGKHETGATNNKQQLGQRDRGEAMQLLVSGIAVEFDIRNSMPGWSDNFNVPIYANVSWQTANEKGFTTTSPFIIATSNLTMGEANNTLLERGPSVDTAAEVTTSQNSPTASNPSPPGGSGSSEPASAGTAGSSLPTGAIAGIAIGGAAALAIVGVLVWFFCFRRRKQHGQVRSAEYGHDAGTHAMMVDKEAPGVSTSSPHSAYGDDGGRLHDRSSAAMDSSYAPYSDHGPASHASPAVAQPMPVHATPVVQPSLPRGTDSPTPSQPATTQYAHLVEEGMTADEIQRLEEEERALDQAIEAAGTNRPGR